MKTEKATEKKRKFAIFSVMQRFKRAYRIWQIKRELFKLEIQLADGKINYTIYNTLQTNLELELIDLNAA
jgi:hypothetical protein